MTNVLRRVCLQGALLVSLGLLPAMASAQTDNPGVNKQLGRLDLGVMGIGQFTNTTNGINNQKSTNPGVLLNTRPSKDFNGYGQIRYTVSKWVGLEFNYVHGRTNYNFRTTVPEPNNTTAPYFIGIATNASEFSFGWVVHPHPTKYLKPFASIGAGTIDFAPTAGGGNQNKAQGRAAYFAAIGVDAPITPNFGLRAQFREVTYKHPDYQINIYRDLTYNYTAEPAVGFYLRF